MSKEVYFEQFIEKEFRQWCSRGKKDIQAIDNNPVLVNAGDMFRAEARIDVNTDFLVAGIQVMSAPESLDEEFQWGAHHIRLNIQDSESREYWFRYPLHHDLISGYSRRPFYWFPFKAVPANKLLYIELYNDEILTNIYIDMIFVGRKIFYVQS